MDYNEQLGHIATSDQLSLKMIVVTMEYNYIVIIPIMSVPIAVMIGNI